MIKLEEIGGRICVAPSLPAALRSRDGGSRGDPSVEVGLRFDPGLEIPTSRVQSDHWHTVIPRKKARCVGGTIISALLCVK